MTDAEKRLWRELRRRNLLNFKFRRQHPLGPYILDFVCLEQKLVIEVDGSQHVQREGEDARRTQWLASMGYRVVRFWNHEILQETNFVTERIWHEIQAPVPPTLTLPLKGGGKSVGPKLYGSRSTRAIEEKLDQLIAENSTLVKDYLSGKDAVVNALFGACMKAFQGKGNPGVIRPLLEQKLKKLREGK